MAYFKVVSLFLLMAVFIACSKIRLPSNEKPVSIDFSNTVQETVSPADSVKPVNLEIAAMVSPRETLRYYEDLVHYISRKIGRPIKINQKKTYKEVNDQLEQRQIDAAFICSGAFVEAKSRFPIEIIAVPVVNGKKTYNAQVIVRKDSPIHHFEDLRGKTFAFTDPLSNTGRLYAVERVRELHSTPGRFFSKVIYTHGHDYSIQAVARGMVDGATVDGLVLNYIKAYYPEKVKNIRIIETSKPFGMPPVVVHKSLNYRLKKKLRQALLNMDKDPQGKKILERLMIDKFVPGNENDYLTIGKNLKFSD